MARMKPSSVAWAAAILAGLAGRPAAVTPTAFGGQPDYRAEFLRLCDDGCRAVQRQAQATERIGRAYYWDSYVVRALAVAHDLTGNRRYLDACKQWSDRMIELQGGMIPKGAYYMQYGRRPGEDKGNWYVADCSSTALGVLATSIRCTDPDEKRRYLDSVRSFAGLVAENFVRPSGGVTDGYWPKSDKEWWCSSGIFGSLAFCLYAETGEQRYLEIGLGTIDWLNRQDLLTVAEHYPPEQIKPTVMMYCLEAYSAGLPYLEPGTPRHRAAMAQWAKAHAWMSKNLGGRAGIDYVSQWGSKFGGLPFHMYVYARRVPGNRHLAAAADRELRHIAGLLDKTPPSNQRDQLALFAMMSYAERLSPGSIYRTSKTLPEAAGIEIKVHDKVLHEIDPRLFGQFMERPSWGGEIGPEGSLIPGTHKLRPEAKELIRKMRIPVARFPGGTDVDYINWLDMIDHVPGRTGGRPVTTGHTGNRVTNNFGYDEFLRLCEELRMEPILVVNFRDGLLAEDGPKKAAAHAAKLVAYCNARPEDDLPKDLAVWSRLRAKNGHPAPYGVKYFQIGNETWAFSGKASEDHYIAALEAYVDAIRAVDPTARLIVDGQPAKLAEKVFRRLGDRIAYFAVHHYQPWQIGEIRRAGEPVDVEGLTTRDIWYAWVSVPRFDQAGQSVLLRDELSQARALGYQVAMTEWNWNGWWGRSIANRTEPSSLYIKGVGAAGILHAIMRQGDVVRLAAQSMLIGDRWGIHAICCDRHGRTPPYMLPSGQVTMLYARHHGNKRLKVDLAGVPRYEQPLRMAGIGPAHSAACLDVLATRDPKTLYLHVINRHFDRPLSVEVDLSALGQQPGPKGTLHSLVGRLRNAPGPGEPQAPGRIRDEALDIPGNRFPIRLPPRSVSVVEVPLGRPGSQAGNPSGSPFRLAAWQGGPPPSSPRSSVPKQHPRLFGPRQRLQRLARQRAEAYRRVVSVAREQQADEHAKMVSMALVCAVERDEDLGRRAVEMAMKTVTGPIRKGHVPFAHDLARCAIVYDLCHEHWKPQQRAKFHQYVNRTVDANLSSETHVFHNGWYGYKNWGIGLACYAAYYENPRAAEILRSLEAEIRSRAVPALELAGDGGGWAEGYYVNYWLYEWLFFCEVARWCEGIDYYALAPKFFQNRAVAGMFETYPGIDIYNSRRPIPMGDGGGRLFGGDRDKALSARRILVNHFREDPAHRAVHALNETTPRSSVGVYAYKDFLWRDPTVEKADLSGFRLSHISPGPGYVYARSSWDDEATYLFFKCGDRFTAHQHLDVGHFLIYKHEELIGDGGHYDAFGSPHDVNYHLRSIAHNTILVHDPAETWPGIRAGEVTGNDGGQAHDWPHHNGAVVDAAQWQKDRRLYDIADILAFEDCGEYVYVAGDCTRAYSPKKLEYFTRQIVFCRPNTFVVFDRVASRNPGFRKTWLLQAIKRPERAPPGLVITVGKGRLFVQTVLPRDARVKLVDGPDLYRFGGKAYPPQRDTGPAPECRVEISPSQPAHVDYFLHVLTAADASTNAAPQAAAEVTDEQVRVIVGKSTVSFSKAKVGGYAEIAGRRRELPEKIVPHPPETTER